MTQLCRSAEELVDAAPIVPVKTAVRTVVELSAYPDGHAGIAVGRVDAAPGTRGARPYTRVADMPLNHREELAAALSVLLDRLFSEGRKTER